MLEKYQSFFAKDGITSTSANHLCNIAREYVALAKTEMSRINFVSLAVGVLGSENPPVTINKGTGNIESINDCIDKITKSNAFIAYMQEAIKAKNTLFSEVQNMRINEYVEIKGIKMPISPDSKEHKTFEDFFAEMNIKEKCRYYALEAAAAVIGKAIHPDGSFHTARKKMFEALSAPAYVDDNKVYHREVAVDQKSVEALYFELQKKHRAIEAELNSIKNSIETKVREYNTALDSEFAKEWNQYSVETKALQNDFSNWKNEEVKRINKLKIAIPESLQESYDFLTNL